MIRNFSIKSTLLVLAGCLLIISCTSDSEERETSADTENQKVDWENVDLDSNIREQLLVPEFDVSGIDKNVSLNGKVLAEFHIQREDLKADTFGFEIIKLEVSEWLRSNFYLNKEDYQIKSLDTLIARYDAFLKSESELMGMATGWEITAGASIVFNQNGFLTYQLSVYSYTGGAHGNGIVDFRNYDIVSGKRLELVDIFADTIKLKEIINEQFNTVMSPEIKENIYVDEIPLTNNIKLDSDSMLFFFNSYEIGPYSMGPVELKIANKDLNSLLKLNLN